MNDLQNGSYISVAKLIILLILMKQVVATIIAKVIRIRINEQVNIEHFKINLTVTIAYKICKF